MVAGERSARPAAGSGGARSGRSRPEISRVAAPLREQVAELIRREIIELRMVPGQRLVERELMERTGVSRSTIREVLRQLSAEGLVQNIPQRGAIVAVPTAREAAEVYEVRALLEPAVVEQFVQRASVEEVALLRTVFDEVNTDEASDELARSILRAKTFFYEVLFAGADNATIKTILEGLQARIALLRSRTLLKPGRPEESIREIRAIIDAVELRDPDAAGAAACFHVRQAAAAALEAP